MYLNICKPAVVVVNVETVVFVPEIFTIDVVVGAVISCKHSKLVAFVSFANRFVIDTLLLVAPIDTILPIKV